MVPAGRKGQADLRANVQCLEAELWSLVALPLLVFHHLLHRRLFISSVCLVPVLFIASCLRGLPSQLPPLLGFPLPLTFTSQAAQCPQHCLIPSPGQKCQG